MAAKIIWRRKAEISAYISIGAGEEGESNVWRGSASVAASAKASASIFNVASVGNGVMAARNLKAGGYRPRRHSAENKAVMKIGWRGAIIGVMA
jgi:hypothetical protein